MAASTDWTMVSALAALASILLVAVSTAILAWELYELKRATAATAYSTALSFLQTDEMRSARKSTFALEAKPYASWDSDEKSMVSKVCQGYDLVAIMVSNGMLPERILVENWGHSMLLTWQIAKPLAHERRTERGEDYWDDFERLAAKVEPRVRTTTARPS